MTTDFIAMDDKFDNKKMIEEIRSLDMEADEIYNTAMSLLSMHGRMCRNKRSIYIKANPDKKSLTEAGFSKEEITKIQQGIKKHLDSEWNFANTRHFKPHITKEAFLEMCNDIYDQKEIEYVDKDNLIELDITSTQVKRFIAHEKKKASKEGNKKLC